MEIFEIVEGKIKAVKCDHCGHHEIVLEKEDGTQIQLKPGVSASVKVKIKCLKD